MKKTVSIFLIVFIVIVSSLSVNAKNPKNMVIVGDSITTGFGLENYTSENPENAKDSFANIVADKCGLVYGENYFNFAVNGAASYDIYWRVSEISDEYLSSADTVILSVGGNDLLYTLGNVVGQAIDSQSELLDSYGINIDTSSYYAVINTLVNIVAVDTDGTIMKKIQDECTNENAENTYKAACENFKENLDSILDTIYSANPSVNIYLLTLYNPFDEMPVFKDVYDISEKTVSMLNDIIRKSAEKNPENLFIIDAEKAFKGKSSELTNIMSMDIHPNKKGHSVIAKLIENEMGISQTENSETQSSEIVSEVSEISKSLSENSQVISDTNTNSALWIITGCSVIGIIAVVGILLVLYRRKRHN
ncbi:MAG: SGNH/GDSL hydrolase family protein [Clostridia bacterium]|nr:SGNH/GDSL hydrolase family protein [Clostridia bacterium]